MYKWVFAFLWATVQCRQPALGGHPRRVPRDLPPLLSPIPSHLLDPGLPSVSWHPQGPSSPVERLRLQDSAGQREEQHPWAFQIVPKGYGKGEAPPLSEWALVQTTLSHAGTCPRHLLL